jgi:hypothetical protein
LRIAALAFGVVAGLIASLILALGGLDVAATAQFASERQVQISRFGLFVVANLGVFGAGLVLASPLGGAVLFSVGALAWLIAALFLHHSTDLVLIVPPALLLIAGGLSLISFMRRERPIKVPPLKFGRRAAVESPEEYEQVPQIRVGAGFFGEGGTAQPLRNAADPNLGSMDERDSPDDWEPGRRRRAVPPRQRQVFRQPDMDEPEDTGFSRFARGLSSILSFGLYAAVAGAVILVAWNLHFGGGEHPAAAKLEPAATTAVKPAPAKPAAPALTATAPAASTAPAAPPTTVATAQQPPRAPVGVVVATPTIAAPGQPVTQPRPDQTALQPPGTDTASAPASDAASADQASTASDDSQTADTSTVMPYPMPPQIAAERGGAPSKAGRSAPQPLNSTGL